MILKRVGSRIKELRNEQSMSQQKLATKAEIDRTYLTGVEAGKRNISIKNLEKILKALGISFEDFFESTDVDYK